MEIKKFDKIEVPLLDIKRPVEEVKVYVDDKPVWNNKPNNILGVAQYDAKAGEFVTLFTEGNLRFFYICWDKHLEQIIYNVLSPLGLYYLRPALCKIH